MEANLTSITFPMATCLCAQIQKSQSARVFTFIPLFPCYPPHPHFSPSQVRFDSSSWMQNLCSFVSCSPLGLAFLVSAHIAVEPSESRTSANQTVRQVVWRAHLLLVQPVLILHEAGLDPACGFKARRPVAVAAPASLKARRLNSECSGSSPIIKRRWSQKTNLKPETIISITVSVCILLAKSLTFLIHCLQTS